MTKNPILAVFVNGEKKFRAEVMPGLYLANIDAIQEKLGEAFFDLTKETFSGTRLSNKACTLIARELGTRWLPAIVNPTIKGLILDLDNTLYNGVLGEDGIDGIRVTKGHQALQQYILTLKEKGLFITICSRNEEADVLEMLNKNPDFQIKLSDLSAHRVNWNSKSQNIIEIAQELRVAPDALLLIDDNAGELVEVTERLSAVRTIHAKEDPLETLAALTYFPNLFKWGVSEEDEKRVSDLKTSKGREQLLSEATTPEAYLRKLGVTLILEQDIKSRLLRIAEMSQKTNQFNLNFKRYSAVDIENICSDTSYSFVTCSLKDNLSDSGVISIIVVRKKNDRAIVEELCVSCRALGRRLEDTLLMKSFELAMRKLHCTSIAVEYQTRERNQPGLKWLAKASNTSLEKQGVVTLPQLKVPFEDVITIVSPDT